MTEWLTPSTELSAKENSLKLLRPPQARKCVCTQARRKVSRTWDLRHLGCDGRLISNLPLSFLSGGRGWKLPVGGVCVRSPQQSGRHTKLTKWSSNTSIVFSPREITTQLTIPRSHENTFLPSTSIFEMFKHWHIGREACQFVFMEKRTMQPEAWRFSYTLWCSVRWLSCKPLQNNHWTMLTANKSGPWIFWQTRNNLQGAGSILLPTFVNSYTWP